MEKYKYLIVSFTTLFLCQIIKFVIDSIKCKKLKWGRLFNGTGGIPSSHTSFSFSIVFMLAFNEGIESPLFVMALVFALIVAYDAFGLRRESGLQAEAINVLLDEVFESSDGFNHLKEGLGHRPIEVFVGILFALIITLSFNIIVF